MAKSSFGTNVYGPDTSFIEGVGNIASMFDPKAQATAALAKAHEDYYSNQARFAAAQAAGVEDQNNAYSPEALARAGYTPIQIAAIRAARSKSVADIFKGVNLNTGAGMITNSDPDIQRQGTILLGDAAAALNPNASFSDTGATAVSTRNTNNKIAETLATPRTYNLGDTAYNINPDGSTNILAEGDVRLRPGESIFERNSAGINTTPTVTAPVPAGAYSGSNNPLRSASDESRLEKEITNTLYVALGTPDPDHPRAWLRQPSAENVRSLSARAIELIKNGMPLNEAISQSAKDHGIELNQSSLVDAGDNKFTIKGFRPPSTLAGVVAPTAPTTSTNSNNTQGLIRITNDAAGRAAWESLPAGTKYVAPDGKVLTKK